MTAVDSSPVFVGRDAELGILEERLGRAAAGEPSVVVIGGESGVGKTRLVSEFSGRVGDRAVVLEGRCFPAFGHGLPYAPFAELFRDLRRRLSPVDAEVVVGSAARELGLMVPGSGAGRSPHTHDATLDARAISRARMFELVLGVADRLQRRVPVVVVVDDLQWADQATLDLLAFLVRGARDSRMLLLLTLRTDEPRGDGHVLSALGELERTGLVERIELRRFSRSEIEALVAAILQGSPDPELVDRVAARSDGNAFFVEELVAAERRGDRAEMPPLLDDLLRARIAAVPEATRRVLRVAAVAGMEIDDGLVASAAGLSPDGVATALRLAAARGLLVRHAFPVEGYAFRHSLLQQAVERELLPGERRSLHAAYAEALEHSSEPTREASEIARHWSLADRPERALPAAVTAGIDAEQRYAFADARRYFELALSLVARIPPDAAPAGIDLAGILAHAADTAALSGDPSAAVTLANKALASLGPLASPDRAATILENLRWYLWQAGRYDDAERTLEEAYRRLPVGTPTRTRARIVGQLGGLYLQQGRVAESLEMADRAIDDARATGAVAELALALGVRGLGRATFGRADEGIADVREALAIADIVGGPDGRALAVTNLAQLLLYCGRIDEARQTALAALDEMPGLGLELIYGGSLAATAAAAAFALGRWTEARDLCARSLSTPAGRAAMVWPTAVALRLAAATRDAELARTARTAAEESQGIAGDRVSSTWLGVALAEVDLADGAIGKGVERATGAIEALPAAVLDEPAGSLFVLALRGIADRAEAAEAAGDSTGRESRRSAAAALAAEWRRRRDAAGEAVPDAGILAAIDAICAAEAGRAAGLSDPAAWAQAAVAHGQLGRRYPAAYARYRQAEAILLRSPRDSVVGTRKVRSTAAEALGEALAAARELGATPLWEATALLARRARIELPAAAERAAVPAEGTGERGMPDRTAEFVRRRHLTAREVEVLSLVGAGWSNREIADALFISDKTASVHVSNILGKLGVSDRVEAAVLAERAGLVGLPKSEVQQDDRPG